MLQLLQRHPLTGNEDVHGCCSFRQELWLWSGVLLLTAHAQVPLHVLQPAPRHVLAGHSDVVTCLAVDSGLDLVLSAAADGVLLMHTLRTGR
jgi:hypothetical protein